MNQHSASLAGTRRMPAGTHRRDALAAAAVAVAVLGFLAYAISSLSREASSAGGVTGVIVSKTFVPAPETQITFGSGGLHSRQVAGQYRFTVRVPEENNRIYTVLVDPAVYAARREGERFYFVRPPAPARLNTPGFSSVPP